MKEKNNLIIFPLFECWVTEDIKGIAKGSKTIYFKTLINVNEHNIVAKSTYVVSPDVIRFLDVLIDQTQVFIKQCIRIKSEVDS